jgi:hypothetical protein
MAKQPYPGLRGGPEEVTVNFRFQIDGTSDPDAFFGSGGLVTDIVRDGAGAFSITLDKNYAFTNVVCAHVSVEDDLDVAGKYISWTGSTRVLVVNTVVHDGSPAAGDPADDSWVHVSVTFCRRTNLATSQSI